jgi:cysteine desulfurase
MVRWLEGASKEGRWADPSRVHSEGRAARAELEEAREKLAALVGVPAGCVVFTSSGTEAANAACFAASRRNPGAVVLAAGVEHSAVRESASRCAELVEIRVDGYGRIDPTEVADILGRLEREGGRVALVNCQAANHEVGTLQPVAEVVSVCRERGVLVHVDACAAFGHLPFDIGALGADMVSLSAHKAGGPPGIGALVVRRGLRVQPLLVGGSQERARRAGLENLLGAVGFAAMADALLEPGRLGEEAARAKEQTSRIVDAAVSAGGVELLGDPEPAGRLPHIASFGIEGVDGEPLLLALDQAGIAAHSGSSCSSETLEPSPVLLAMGKDPERSLRVSVGWSTTEEDVEAFEKAFAQALDRLRALRPG